MGEKTKKCAFYTLGCKVNQYDTESLVRLFRERGYDIVNYDSPADVYCINTCTVTHVSDRKSRQAIRRGKKQNPSAVVAVVGCYAQAAPEELAAIPGVDVIAGTRERRALVDMVERAMQGKGPVMGVHRGSDDEPFEELSIEGFAGRIRGFVKVQDGCDECCSYCKVPHVRGRSRSRLPEDVLAEVERLVEAGHKEIVITGVHLGAYGRDLAAARPGVAPDLPWLVERVHDVRGIGRVRVSSIEPLDASERLIAVVADLPRVARHFHVPLQSGDDVVLAKMNRNYQASGYERLVERIREAVSPVGITTDIMVGFPGETDEMFMRSYVFARRIGFSRMHVFKYSRRPGTCAARMPGQVDAATTHARSEKLIELGHELAGRFHASLVGGIEDVLVEEHDAERGTVTGLGSTYVRVELPGTAGLVGGLVPVSLIGATMSLVLAQRVAPGEEGFEPRNEK